jgi:hypothetical protein
MSKSCFDPFMSSILTHIHIGLAIYDWRAYSIIIFIQAYVLFFEPGRQISDVKTIVVVARCYREEDDADHYYSPDILYNILDPVFSGVLPSI